jgi:hypothetical protein
MWPGRNRVLVFACILLSSLPPRVHKAEQGHFQRKG